MSARFAFLLLFSLLSTLPAGAATRNWSGGVFGGGQFTDGGSWFNGVPTSSLTADTARFNGFTSGPINRTINVDLTRQIAGLKFDAPTGIGSAVAFTMTGRELGLGAVGVDVAAGASGSSVIKSPLRLRADQEWTLDNHLRIEGQLLGSSDLTKFGNGTLHVTSSGRHEGEKRIADGVLRMSGGGRIWDRSDVIISAGAALRYDGIIDAINGLFGTGLVDLRSGSQLVIGNSINNSEGVGYFAGKIQGANGKLSKRGPGTFTLANSNDYTGDTFVEGGTLLLDAPLGSATGTGDVTVYDGATLGGAGGVDGKTTVRAGGRLTPGFTPDQGNTSEGRLLMLVEAELQAGSVLQIDLGGTFLPEDTWDVLLANHLTLAGDLEVNLKEEIEIAPGDTFEIVAGNLSLSGQFANHAQGSRVASNEEVDLYLDYTQQGGQVIVLEAERRGDFNRDGSVDAADYTVWRDNPSGDFTAEDYDAWLMNYGRVATPAPAAMAVPEPGSAWLGGLALAALGRRRG